MMYCVCFYSNIIDGKDCRTSEIVTLDGKVNIASFVRQHPDMYSMMICKTKSEAERIESANGF